MLDWSKDFSGKFPGMKMIIKHKILETNLILEKTDKAFFTNFIKSPYQQCKLWDKDILKGFWSNKSFGDYGNGKRILEGFLGCKLGLEKLVTEYLEVFLRSEADFTDFKGYIDLTEMKRIYVRAQLKRGKEVKTLPVGITDKYIKDLETSQTLKLVFGNRKSFAVDEPVSLRLEVKNLPSVEILVYEVNTLNYCMAELKNFSDDIDLEGLVPKAKRCILSNENAYVSKQTKYDFPEIATPGVFIVQFLGGGIKTRAIIYKGSLSLIPKLGSTGLTVQIINEKKEILKGENTGIFLDKKSYS
jgi:hypothetical protein